MAKEKVIKPEKTPEEKAAAADRRKANLAAANKKRAELAAANKLNPPADISPVVDNPAAKEEDAPTVEDTPTVEDAPAEDTGIPEMSEEFNTILPDIHAGKEVTLEGEKGVYFKFEDNRLKKFSKQGAHMDSYPLYAFQNRKGWRLKK